MCPGRSKGQQVPDTHLCSFVIVQSEMAQATVELLELDGEILAGNWPLGGLLGVQLLKGGQPADTGSSHSMGTLSCVSGHIYLLVSWGDRWNWERGSQCLLAKIGLVGLEFPCRVGIAVLKWGRLQEQMATGTERLPVLTLYFIPPPVSSWQFPLKLVVGR